MNNKTNNKHSGSIFAQPLHRILLTGLALVAVVPLIFLGFKLYQLAWEEAWREISEKHQLLAQNLAAPISLYVEDQMTALGLLSSFINYAHAKGPIDSIDIQRHQVIRDAMKRLDGFRSVSLVNLEGSIVISTRKDLAANERALFEREKCYLYTRSNDKWFLSGIKQSPFDLQPAVMMSMPVHDSDGRQRAVLMGELRIDLIEELRQRIKFGIKGHSAIMDQNGRVVAHPNADWMASMKDLASLSIVQKMMRGETGVTEFYSPFIKANMVAGYAAVPGINWGIMVPQPKPEVEARVNRILHAQLTWGLIGLALALLIAWLLARWISVPMKKMSAVASGMPGNQFKGGLPAISRYAPYEVQSLCTSFDTMVKGLQGARDELDNINQSLQSRVDEATHELQKANKQLQHVASRDYLTGLYNRRYFELYLAEQVSAATAHSADLNLLMLDIDNFKSINDQYGHAAGDHILISMADTLRKQVGKEHLIARFAGDEFVILATIDAHQAELLAADILQKISRTEFRWQHNPVSVTVSIGLHRQRYNDGYDIEELLHGADRALYDAKDNGRNTISVKSSIER